MPLDYFTPLETDARAARLRVLRQVRKSFGFIALAAFIFGWFHAGDGDPLQWPTAIACTCAFDLYLLAACVVWLVGLWI